VSDLQKEYDSLNNSNLQIDQQLNTFMKIFSIILIKHAPVRPKPKKGTVEKCKTMDYQ